MKQVDNKYAAVCGTNAVIMTEWDAYKSPDYRELGERLKDRVVFDGRNILEASEVRKAGLVYIGIGQPGWVTGATGRIQLIFFDIHRYCERSDK